MRVSETNTYPEQHGDIHGRRPELMPLEKQRRPQKVQPQLRAIQNQRPRRPPDDRRHPMTRDPHHRVQRRPHRTEQPIRRCPSRFPDGRIPRLDVVPHPDADQLGHVVRGLVRILRPCFLRVAAPHRQPTTGEEIQKDTRNAPYRPRRVREWRARAEAFSLFLKKDSLHPLNTHERANISVCPVRPVRPVSSAPHDSAILIPIPRARSRTHDCIPHRSACNPPAPQRRRRRRTRVGAT